MNLNGRNWARALNRHRLTCKSYRTVLRVLMRVVQHNSSTVEHNYKYERLINDILSIKYKNKLSLKKVFIQIELC